MRQYTDTMFSILNEEETKDMKEWLKSRPDIKCMYSPGVSIYSDISPDHYCISFEEKEHAMEFKLRFT